jgi:hypothetical protein
MRRVPGPSLFELDRLDPQQRRRLRLVGLHVGKEPLGMLALEEERNRLLGLPH